MKITTKLIILLPAALLVVAVIWWLRSSPTDLPATGTEGTILSHAITLQPFTLTDQLGKPFTLERLKGHWTLLFFGYTHCPDVCPTTLGVLKEVAQQLEKTPAVAQSTSTVFVSVDPRRDSPEQLKQYITYFNPVFTALTGDKAQIDNLAGQVGVVYSFEGNTSGDDYTVNHSAAIMLIDPQGEFYARFDAPHTSDGIVDGYLRIRAFHDH